MADRDATTRFLRLAAANVRSKLAEQLAVRTGIDRSRPVQIYATLTRRCNGRCLMCMLWRNEPLPELPAEIWLSGLRSIRRLSGSCHVQFCAAEPLLKADLFDILVGCRAMGVSFGITTNGYLLNECNIARLLEVGVFNVNVSIDSMDPAVHDRTRGMDGLLETTRANVERLIARAKGRIRVIIRPLIMKDNVRTVHEVVQYARRIGAHGVNIQPVMKWSAESEDMFDVPPDELDACIDRLIAMKQAGAPILNSVAAMRMWKVHFSEESAAERNGLNTAQFHCLAIDADGEVAVSQTRDSRLGNIATDDLAALWRSARARELRRELMVRDRPAVATSAEKRSWRDYLNLFRRLM